MTAGISVNAHSSIRVEAEKVICFDPFHMTTAPRDADLVFITHPHYDHFSPEDIEKAAGDRTVFIAPASMKEELQKVITGSRSLVLMNPQEQSEICGIPCQAVRAYNPAKKFHPRDNGWLGYVITVGGQRIYVCGDTDVTPEASAVQCDVLILPVGGKYTMNAQQAAELVESVRPACAIPTHYGDIVGAADDGARFAALAGGFTEVRLLIG